MYPHNVVETFSPLHLACINGDIEMVKTSLLEGRDINQVTVEIDSGKGMPLSSNPLIFAVRHNNLEIVKMLIANGANVNACPYGTITPLNNACLLKNYKMVRLLLDSGANPLIYPIRKLFDMKNSYYIEMTPLRDVLQHINQFNLVETKRTYKIIVALFCHGTQPLPTREFDEKTNCVMKRAFIESLRTELNNSFKIILLANKYVDDCLFYKDSFPLDMIKTIHGILTSDFEKLWYEKTK